MELFLDDSFYFDIRIVNLRFVDSAPSETGCVIRYETGYVDGKQFCKWRARDLPAEVGASLGGSRTTRCIRGKIRREIEYSLDKFQLMGKGMDSSVASVSSNGPFNFCSESACYAG